MSEYTTMRDNFDEILGRLDPLLAQVQDKIGFDLEARTKQSIIAYGAVDTSHMLDTTQYNPAKKAVEVPAEYAGHVHDGYSIPGGATVAGRPFFSVALLEVFGEIPAELEPEIVWSGDRDNRGR